MSFIQDDIGVGHDIYCTTWDSLREDARYGHPHIGKLMDSGIVYCADEKYRAELEALRTQVRTILSAPFGAGDIERGERELREALSCYARVMTADLISEIRRHAGGAVYYLENAVALLNRTYFRRGVRHCYEELAAAEKKPARLCERIEDVVAAKDAERLKSSLTLLVKYVISVFEAEKASIDQEQDGANAVPAGTYEEMFSNWHGKMRLAAETGNRHLAFMSLSGLDSMLADMSPELRDKYDAFSVYDPGNLQKTADEFDELLEAYLSEYRAAGLTPRRYPDINAFTDDYLNVSIDN